jgi:acyl carrier protein
MNHGQTDGGHENADGEAPALGVALRAAAPFARTRLLSNAIRERLCERLGLLPSEIEEGSRFIDLGIDSLVAVEMQTFLVTETGVPLKSTVIFDYPTIGKLVAFILQRMDGDPAAAVPAPRIEPQPTNVTTPRDPTDVAANLQNELREIQALLDGGRNG